MTASKMTPTVGRIVHYTNLGDRDGKFPPEIQAAIVTGINPHGSVSLCVLYRTGFFFMDVVDHAEDGVEAGTEEARGYWQWPRREA